jgi:uroporphyrinogen decarboxylase
MRTMSDVERLRPLEPSEVPYLSQAVSALVAELGATPLIGFAGAPFTLASYLIEGGPSREHARTKALMHGEPALWHALLARLAAISTTYLRVQVDAGAAAVQLFDSWAGALSAADYERFVLPHSRAVLESLAGRGVPRIHFGVGSGELLALMRAAGAEVVGVDWRVPLPEAGRRIGTGAVVQGNLDPALLLAEWPVVDAEVRRIVAEGRRAGGHIFNLGHGVLPETDPDVLTRVVALVKELTG